MNAISVKSTRLKREVCASPAIPIVAAVIILFTSSPHHHIHMLIAENANLSDPLTAASVVSSPPSVVHNIYNNTVFVIKCV